MRENNPGRVSQALIPLVCICITARPYAVPVAPLLAVLFLLLDPLLPQLPPPQQVPDSDEHPASGEPSSLPQCRGHSRPPHDAHRNCSRVRLWGRVLVAQCEPSGRHFRGLSPVQTTRVSPLPSPANPLQFSQVDSCPASVPEFELSLPHTRSRLLPRYPRSTESAHTNTSFSRGNSGQEQEATRRGIPFAFLLNCLR